MPLLGISELNIVLTGLSGFVGCFAFFSYVIKGRLFLGEALPAMIVGAVFGPYAAKIFEPSKFDGSGSLESTDVSAITLGLCRIVIGVQLVIAGFQLPKKYIWERWRDMAIALLPIMTLMWLFTATCVFLIIPKVTFLSALVIGACVTCTDPVLSQAIAKGAFADKFVARPLREIISAEAGANDGFGFPFLMLAVYIMRFNNDPDVFLHPGHDGVGALGGGAVEVIKNWILECLLYFVLLSVVYGAIIGYGSCKALKFALKRGWIDSESYLLWATITGLFILGTGGLMGTDDILATFVAGCFLNWDGRYQDEAILRHDEVNTSIDFLLNMGGFAWIGAVMPWKEFHQPEITGITWPILLGLGFAILFFRRIPAILMMYKLMPHTIANWGEALFAGYFGPIGIGAVFYLEHTKHIIPHSHGDPEERDLLGAMVPVVYFLVMFSIVVHGLSIPLLNFIYIKIGKEELRDDDDAVTIRPRSIYEQPPANAVSRRGSIVAYNRFSRPRDLEFEAETEDWKSTYTFDDDEVDEDQFPLHLHGVKSEDLQQGPRKRRRAKDMDIAAWRGHSYSKSQPEFAHVSPTCPAGLRSAQETSERTSSTKAGLPWTPTLSRQNTDTCVCSRASTTKGRNPRSVDEQRGSRAASRSRASLSRSASSKNGGQGEVDSQDLRMKRLEEQVMAQGERDRDLAQDGIDPVDLEERVKALQQQRQTSFDLNPRGEAEYDCLDEKLKGWSGEGKMA